MLAHWLRKKEFYSSMYFILLPEFLTFIIQNRKTDEQSKVLFLTLEKNLWVAGDVEGYLYESWSINCYLKMLKASIQTISVLISKNNIAISYYWIIYVWFDLWNYSFPRVFLTSNIMFAKEWKFLHLKTYFIFVMHVRLFPLTSVYFPLEYS